MTDMVSKPPHYQPLAGIKGEAIEYTRQMPFSLGSALKYVWRAGSKGDAVQDLQKALWYVLDAAEHGSPLRGRVPLITDASVPMTRRRYVLGRIADGDTYSAQVLIRDLIEHPEHLDKEMR